MIDPAVSTRGPDEVIAKQTYATYSGLKLRTEGAPIVAGSCSDGVRTAADLAAGHECDVGVPGVACPAGKTCDETTCTCVVIPVKCGDGNIDRAAPDNEECDPGSGDARNGCPVDKPLCQADCKCEAEVIQCAGTQIAFDSASNKVTMTSTCWVQSGGVTKQLTAEPNAIFSILIPEEVSLGAITCALTPQGGTSAVKCEMDLTAIIGNYKTTFAADPDKTVKIKGIITGVAPVTTGDIHLQTGAVVNLDPTLAVISSNTPNSGLIGSLIIDEAQPSDPLANIFSPAYPGKDFNFLQTYALKASLRTAGTCGAYGADMDVELLRNSVSIRTIKLLDVGKGDKEAIFTQAVQTSTGVRKQMTLTVPIKGTRKTAFIGGKCEIHLQNVKYKIT